MRWADNTVTKSAQDRVRLLDMDSNITIIHYPSSLSSMQLSALNELERVCHGSRDLEFVLWKTCIRTLVFTNANASQLKSLKGCEVLLGKRAFQCCMEIVSGLHSPILGETEVYGQFKAHFCKREFPQGPWGQQLKRLVDMIIINVKKIRTEHLQDLGSQSYGSRVRKICENFGEVDVIGAGQLAQSIVPWLKDKERLNIYSRKKKSIHTLFKKTLIDSKKLNVHDYTIDQLGVVNKPRALILAAPIENETLCKHLLTCQVEVIVDLRGEVETVGEAYLKSLSIQYIKLNEFFERLSEAQTQIDQKKNSALLEIDQIANQWNAFHQHRPYGWEDLCG